MNPTDQKVLGVRWDIRTDCLVFSVQEIAAIADIDPTKRRVTSIVGKLYDLLGFLSPVVVKFKMFLRKSLRGSLTGMNHLLERFGASGSRQLERSSVPRFYLQDFELDGASYSLCGFCDASMEAYAAVIYLLVQTSTRVYVRFVTSKTRVTPRRELTIPRLELLSALLLARLLDSVTKGLSPNLCLNQPTCYTDSQVALYWIVGHGKEWKQFVNNRVLEIRELVPVGCWHHCPGIDNPVDIPLRGLSPTELSASRLWHCGPDWLQEASDESPVVKEMPTGCLTEVKSKAHSLLVGDTDASLQNILKCENFSSLSRHFSVTTYVMRFVKALARACSQGLWGLFK